jgi:hypothetical protein
MAGTAGNVRAAASPEGSTGRLAFGSHAIHGGRPSIAPRTLVQMACCATALRMQSTSSTMAAEPAIRAARRANSMTRRSISLPLTLTADELFQAIQVGFAQDLRFSQSDDQLLDGAFAKTVNDLEDCASSQAAGWLGRAVKKGSPMFLVA